MSFVVYGILWVLSRTIGWLCFCFRVVGTVPRTGGFIVAANHASYLDIPLLGCGMRRRAWFLGRSDLFPVPGMKAVCQWLGWIPLRLGRLDRDAFSKAVALIKEGKVVVIFPEGRRSLDGQLSSPKPGIGVIVAQTGCSVVPAYLKGTYDVLPSGTMWPRFRPVTVFYGEALTFPRIEEGGDAKQFYQNVSRTVMDRIASLGGVESPTQQSNADIRNAE
ncbi:MAG TPA: lysophospholipid acyltransferase family protein [Nitrospiraceae bacterium]|nr:lysophospholipid acyltransferase family protein [Nitrospiraceae bacterium]